ncbi:MAG: nucleotidyltransferase [Acidobacteriota bacterium]|nr:nucleotidyltransferase [Acidobacteriota bacterium]
MIQLEQTLRLLTDRQVDFVIVGGVAISAHGSAYLTFDLDVCYARTRENLKRLAAALAPYHPRPRDFPENLPFVWDEQTLLQGTNFTLSTDLGSIDLLGEVSGLGNYEQVSAVSVVMSLFARPCRVLSLDALIIAKRAAGRTKDLLVLPELEALREVLQKSED